ncbi:hypothetical protein Taro_050236 [Colocasia esculenta]|uniref:Uncharacterized protein n=1 Tax=Colocasia esculenta TaxID=4460 RepID=A0A843XDJ5_COLES|nr:hypothetical protein [Colocasia esculenta]
MGRESTRVHDDRELDRVRRAAEAGASSSRAAEGSQSDLEDRLAAAVRTAKEAWAELAERETELRTATDRATQLQGQVDTLTGERDQLRIRAEAAEARVAEATRELATLRVQGSSVDQEELARLRVDLHAQQTLARGLQELMTAIGRSRSRSRSGASGASGATGTSSRQYLAGSSSRRRNEDEERRFGGETSARSGRGGGEMPPPPDRHEGSRRVVVDSEQFEALEKCPEDYLKGKKQARLGHGNPPMGLEVEAGHPSSGCPQLSWVGASRGSSRRKGKAGIAAKEEERVTGVAVKEVKECAGDGDRRRKQGITGTGIAVRVLRTGVTGITVKQRRLQQEVTGFAARSWD